MGPAVTEKDYWTSFDLAMQKMNWAVKKYYPMLAPQIEVARKANDVKACRDLANDLWFFLPDHIFNIRENPPGWKEFLDFLEGPGMARIKLPLP